jgi:Ni/Fe-hydrogenase 1 B-type cytochrome subunit
MEQSIANKETGSSYFIQKHSPVIRIWHWLTFILITSIIATVLLNSTLMSQQKNIAVVQDVLKSKEVIVTNDQAFAVTREYEDKLWGVHKILGYAIAILLLSRVFIELMQHSEEKLSLRIKHAMGLKNKNDDRKKEYQHYLRVKFGYLVFYLLILCMALTGLGLAFGRDFGFSRELHDTIKEIHSFGQYCIYAFVLIHLCGVIVADIKNSKGIVSGMINGN